ncbi:MAG TPA: hypothetical protein PLJ26_00825 [Candidatus Omnitrophota bacterium]|nr:hypothetical protein [Candidatus Omnitrophota bacterium]
MKHSFLAILMCMMSACCLAEETRSQPKYVILAWSGSGMHFYSEDFQDAAILPPNNTLMCQVIKVGEPPQIVKSGVIVEYRFRDNTFSAGKDSKRDKTNFWKFARKLFGVDAEVNKGLTGKGLSGLMDAAGDYFIAQGIPITEYRDGSVADIDRGLWERYPFQLAAIVVKDEKTGVELARTSVVAPVSSEVNCMQCHGDAGAATKKHGIKPTGKYQTNILSLHDKLNPDKYPAPLMHSRPVLCASCHASNALGAMGRQGIPSLSNAIHRRHQDLPEMTPDTNGCYNCHPGPRTQFLRDTMSVNYKLNCTTCHGTMSTVARNLEPWKVEPRCDNGSCHGQGYALDKPLFNQSKSKTGIYCAACHDSAHAIAPSRQESDQIKFKDLQSSPGTLRSCAVCHGRDVQKPFKH